MAHVHEGGHGGGGVALVTRPWVVPDLRGRGEGISGGWFHCSQRRREMAPLVVDRRVFARGDEPVEFCSGNRRVEQVF
jgi:hypothetical protein